MTAIPPTSSTDSATRISSLRTQFPDGLIGTPAGPIRLSWQVESDDADAFQVGYEIEAGGDPEFAAVSAHSGVVEGASAVGVPAPGPAPSSRNTRYYRVRIATPTGWTPWSPTARVETGLSASDWSAVAVGIDSTIGGPAPILRTEFELPSAPRRARLYTTSLGLGEFVLNGTRVSPDLLAPGWTSYQARLLVSTVDVTESLVRGRNVLGATVADGWYRGRLGWEDRDAIYGTELAAVAQLEIEFADGSTQRIVSDSGWKGSFGAVRSAGIYDGADYDFTLDQPGWSSAGFDDSGWTPVHEVPLNRGILDNPIATGVREIEAFPMTPAGPVLDAGQNIAGWVRLHVRGKRGDVVTVRHAEILEPDGTLHTRSLRSARATDSYVLASDGEVTLEPNFTFHGFRYADFVSNAELVSATAVAISSATEQRGMFESSDQTLNRLHSNVQWSQRDNFVSVPTDCPQRDERLGWTGDAQAFAATASTLFDTEAFWESWLRDLELDQPADGSVAAVVPNILTDKSFMSDTDIMGRAGWADAATIVPWAVYESFGSTLPLERQLNSMRRWVNYLDERRAGEGLLPTEFQFGDWLDPDAPGAEPWKAKVSSDFVANGFFAHSARILAAAERLVGDPKRAERYQRLGDEVAVSTWAEWGPHAISTQTGCAIALEFSIAPEAERPAIVEALAANVHGVNGRISTGFLGTPLVLHALSRAGKFEEAYQMLLSRELPSWLYQVEMGATTVWERWDALAADGSIHAGTMDTGNDAQMLSFNHYAYGAVIDWVYRNLGGIAPTTDAPGYQTTIFAPRPVAGVDFARASIESAYGRISIDWKIVGGILGAELIVPFGVTARVSLPAGADSETLLNGAPSPTEFTVTHGNHLVTLTNPAVIAHGAQSLVA